MKVFFIDSVHPVLNDRLTQVGMTCYDYTASSLDEILEKIEHADGIVIRSRFKMDEGFLSKATKLKFIARSGAGMENIDLAHCQKQNITCFNAPEGNRNAVAEHALGMLLSLFNKIHLGDQEIRNGQWRREANRGIELEGKTLGIIGYGNNGKAFAKVLAGFDIEVIAYDKYLSDFSDEYAKEVTLETLKQRADIISLHIPQNDETHYMLNTGWISSVVKPFYLINLSRGQIVETHALTSALKSEKILGACLDVLEYEKSSFESFFDQEIPEDFKYLLNSKKVILTPHVGGWTKESYFKLSTVLADKILDKFS